MAQGYGTSDPWTCGFSYQLPLLLPTLLTQNDAITTDMRALGGQRTDQMAAEAQDLAQGNPDIAILELGTNDDRWNWPPEQTQAAYTQILATFAATSRSANLGQTQLVCLGIWPSPGFDAPDHLARYNQAVQAACSAFNGIFVSLQLLYVHLSAYTAFADDGNWHPNDRGATAIATLIVQALLRTQTFDRWCGTPSQCQPPLLDQGIWPPMPLREWRSGNR